jgi:hypothetical protein
LPANRARSRVAVPHPGAGGLLLRACAATFRDLRHTLITIVVVALGVGASGCDTGSNSDSRYGGGGPGDAGPLDPTPEKLDGSESTEFEADDIERAEGASEAVKDYCSDAVSEAQELGCLSHVEESDVP